MTSCVHSEKTFCYFVWRFVTVSLINTINIHKNIQSGLRDGSTLNSGVNKQNQGTQPRVSVLLASVSCEGRTNQERFLEFWANQELCISKQQVWLPPTTQNTMQVCDGLISLLITLYWNCCWNAREVKVYRVTDTIFKIYNIVESNAHCVREWNTYDECSLQPVLDLSLIFLQRHKNQCWYSVNGHWWVAAHRRRAVLHWWQTSGLITLAERWKCLTVRWGS